MEAGLLKLAAWLGAGMWPAVLLVVLCVGSLAVAECFRKPLTNDEIYTLHIAQQPTLGKLLALAREVDLHPPMHYLAVREAMRLPLPRQLAARLPSLLAGIVFLLAVYRFAARRLGNLYGLVAVTITWLTPAIELMWTNRPYMLWLAFLWVLLVIWDRLGDSDASRRWILGLFLVSACMVLTHLLALACLGIVTLAEVTRWGRQRKMNWLILLALWAPAPMALYMRYQMHEVSKEAFPLGQQASFDLLFTLYRLALGNVLIVVAGCVVFAVVVFRLQRMLGRRPRAEVRAKGLQVEEFVLLGSFTLLPVALFVPAEIFHLQFWLRYGVASMPAVGVLLAWALERWLPNKRVVAVLLIVGGVSYMIQFLCTDGLPMNNAGTRTYGKLPVPLSSLDPTLPIVAASPMTFVEMSDREPLDIARRTYYLTDRAAAFQYAHYTLFENEAKIRALLNLPSHAEPLTVFLATHDRFYMLGDFDRPEVWLPRKLAADGLKMEYQGKFISNYETNDLWLISK